MEHFGQDVYFKCNGFHLKTIFSVLKDLFLESDLRFCQNGLVIRGIDPNRATSTVVCFHSPEEYHFVCPRKIGVYMGSLYKIFRSCNNKDTVELFVCNDTPTKLHIRLSSDEVTNSTIVLSSLTVNPQDIMIPKVEYNLVFEVPSKKILRATKEIAHFCKILTVEYSNHSLFFTSQTYSASLRLLLLRQDQDDSYGGESILSSYDVRHVEHFCKNIPSDNVIISVKKDYPIHFEYDVFGVAKVEFNVSPYLQD